MCATFVWENPKKIFQSRFGAFRGRGGGWARAFCRLLWYGGSEWCVKKPLMLSLARGASRACIALGNAVTSRSFLNCDVVVAVGHQAAHHANALWAHHLGDCGVHAVASWQE